MIQSKAGRIGPDDLKEIVFSNRNFAAELILDQVIELCCRSSRVVLQDSQEFDLEQASEILANWNRRDDSESPGAVLFREFWRRAQVNGEIWKISFDSAFPLVTPRGLDIDNAEIAEFLKKALADAATTLTKLEFPLDVCLSQVQRIPTHHGSIAIPGGDGSAGVLNLMVFGVLGKEGYAPIDIQGTSYTQVVSWDGDHVIADAILPFSQSSDKNSPHYMDQTKLFAAKGWVRLPFTEAEIENDPQLTHLRLTK